VCIKLAFSGCGLQTSVLEKNLASGFSHIKGTKVRGQKAEGYLLFTIAKVARRTGYRWQIKENIHANGNDHVLHFLSLLIFSIIGQKRVNLPNCEFTDSGT